MKRLWERFYPYLITIVLLVFYSSVFENSTMNHIKNNSGNLLTSVITLSSVFLGFVCAMLGVLISIKNTFIYRFLETQNVLSDLVRYIKEACLFDFLSLIISIAFLLFTPLTEGDPPISLGLSRWQIYVLLIASSVMVLSSLRMILILFEFVNTDKTSWHNKQNLAGDKPITPKDI